jgi:hypothetical protein
MRTHRLRIGLRTPNSAQMSPVIVRVGTSAGPSKRSGMSDVMKDESAAAAAA